jgi:hypothetical protein
MNEVLAYVILCLLFYIAYMIIGLIEKQGRKFGRWLVSRFWRTNQ